MFIDAKVNFTEYIVSQVSERKLSKKSKPAIYMTGWERGRFEKNFHAV